MTATATRSSLAITEWTKLFPKQITENYTASVTFMKQLTTVAVSTITYLKNVFPEDCYSLENFAGVTLRILKKQCKDELANFLSTSLTQAFEAFEKKYLHQLALCFYEDACKMENLIEYHVFEYAYHDDGVTMSVSSKTRDGAQPHARYSFDGLRDRTVHMVRACVVIMQTCTQQLPETYDISLRLYYNDNAPEGYQAPGFSAVAESEDHLEPTAGDAVKVGWVDTPYHKIVARCYMKDSMGASHEAIASQNPPMMSQMEHEEFSSSVHRSVSETSERPLRCPCNKFGDDTQNVLLLTCQYCNTQQHAACFGVLSEDVPRAAHCCVACYEEDPARIPTDPQLIPLTHKKRECLCIFRRVLCLCYSWRHDPGVSASRLSQALLLSLANARKIMKVLHYQGVVPTADDGLATPQPINAEKLKDLMKKYFQLNEEENIVDRLLAETLASQESQPDPIGDVLGPMENISLQKASNLGQVIETPVDLEDQTLKQYKDALANCPIDLPLNGSNNPLKGIENLGKRRISKRKINEDNDENKSKLRTGVRTKRAKTKAL